MHRMRITQKGKKMNSKNQQKKKEIDWMITLVPLALIVALCIVFFFAPEQSNQVLGQIRFLFGDTFGTYYLVIGLGIFFLSLFLAGSKYGNIVLGKPDEKPKYSFFAWGCMMFTCGLAADILFYSFSEWILYATDPHIAELGSIQEWAGVFPLFHWSFIPWGFYLVLAVAFGFMLHVRKRNRQKYSEACRPILGKQTDGIGGRLIDLLAVFALLAGTATTFSVATPLMAEIIGELFHMEVSRTVINIIILLITCCVYTYSLLHGFKGISILAKVCIYLFFGLLAFVLLFGGETRYIIETGFSSLGKMIQTLSAYQRIRTRCVRQTSHRTGPFITGHTGWYGVWQHRSSLAAFPAEEPCARRFSADTVLVWVPRLSALLFLEIIRWESRFQVQLISFRSIMKVETYII